MRILIVEDDFRSRMLLQKILSRYGSCDIAVNGEEAIEAFSLAHEEHDPYQLICLDIMMPEMDGQEALRIIREKEKSMQVLAVYRAKIFMITALDSDKSVIDAVYRGKCDDYIIKPVERKKGSS